MEIYRRQESKKIKSYTQENTYKKNPNIHNNNKLRNLYTGINILCDSKFQHFAVIIRNVTAKF